MARGMHVNAGAKGKIFSRKSGRAAPEDGGDAGRLCGLPCGEAAASCSGTRDVLSCGGRNLFIPPSPPRLRRAGRRSYRKDGALRFAAENLLFSALLYPPRPQTPANKVFLIAVL